ncbi:MAG: hypothetical protein Q9167_007732 [Letrouitia subvulpina]
MPLAKASVPHKRKRQRSMVESETDVLPQPTVKRQKLDYHQRYRTPSSFWDNLSRQWLTRRALREFDRRIVWPATPVPPHRTGKENIDVAKLKRFARQGGPNLGNVRGEFSIKIPKYQFALFQQCTQVIQALGNEQKPEEIRAHSQQPENLPLTTQLSNNISMIMNNRAQKPSNWANINERLAKPRPSLSPSQFSEAAFETFLQTNEDALTENAVMSKAFPIIAGTADLPFQENLRFGNLKDLTDGSITKAQPDFYDGIRPMELNRQVRERISEYIEPSTKKNTPLLPNFFTEGKGPDGSTPVSERQAMYDGALGARGIHELRLYVDPETAVDNNAYTITSTYHGGSGVLKLFTTHCTPSTNSNRGYEYRMTQLGGWDMTNNPDTFRHGAGALRNARDWAREKREELVTAANGKILNTDHSALGSSTQSFASLSSDKPNHRESVTSADELALNNGTDTRPTLRTPVGARTNPSTRISSNQRLKKKPVGVNKRPGTGYRGLQKI